MQWVTVVVATVALSAGTPVVHYTFNDPPDGTPHVYRPQAGEGIGVVKGSGPQHRQGGQHVTAVDTALYPGGYIHFPHPGGVVDLGAADKWTFAAGGEVGVALVVRLGSHSADRSSTLFAIGEEGPHRRCSWGTAAPLPSDLANCTESSTRKASLDDCYALCEASPQCSTVAFTPHGECSVLRDGCAPTGNATRGILATCHRQTFSLSVTGAGAVRAVGRGGLDACTTPPGMVEEGVWTVIHFHLRDTTMTLQGSRCPPWGGGIAAGARERGLLGGFRGDVDDLVVTLGPPPLEHLQVAIHLPFDRSGGSGVRGEGLQAHGAKEGTTVPSHPLGVLAGLGPLDTFSVCAWVFAHRAQGWPWAVKGDAGHVLEMTLSPTALSHLAGQRVARAAGAALVSCYLPTVLPNWLPQRNGTVETCSAMCGGQPFFVLHEDFCWCSTASPSDVLQPDPSCSHDFRVYQNAVSGVYLVAEASCSPTYASLTTYAQCSTAVTELLRDAPPPNISLSTPAGCTVDTHGAVWWNPSGEDAPRVRAPRHLCRAVGQVAWSERTWHWMCGVVTATSHSVVVDGLTWTTQDYDDRRPVFHFNPTDTLIVGGGGFRGRVDEFRLLRGTHTNYWHDNDLHIVARGIGGGNASWDVTQPVNLAGAPLISVSVRLKGVEDAVLAVGGWAARVDGNGSLAVTPSACPFALVGASSQANGTFGVHRLRAIDDTPWISTPHGPQWVSWSFDIGVEVTGLWVRPAMWNASFRGSLEYSHGGEEWEAVYDIVPEGDSVSFFEHWHHVKARLWRVDMVPTGPAPIAVDYMALRIAGYPSPCPGASDCRYSFVGDVGCNTSSVWTTLDGPRACEEACDRDAKCTGYSHHELQGLCALSFTPCTQNLSADGWVSWGGRYGCGPFPALPPPLDHAVDLRLGWDPRSGGMSLSYSPPQAPPQQGNMYPFAQGKCTALADVTATVGPSFTHKETCIAYCSATALCRVCSPVVCGVVCEYRALTACGLVNAMPAPDALIYAKGAMWASDVALPSRDIDLACGAACPRMTLPSEVVNATTVRPVVSTLGVTEATVSIVVTRYPRVPVRSIVGMDGVATGGGVRGNVEYGGDAVLCGGDVCLSAEGVGMSHGMVHTTSPVEGHVTLQVSFALRGAKAGGGGWGIALHLVGPLLGGHGGGTPSTLFRSSWLSPPHSPVVAVVLTALGNVTVTSPTAPPVSAAIAPFSTSGWRTVWLSALPSGTVEVFVDEGLGSRPPTPVCTTNTTLPEMVWASVGAASGCGELDIHLDVGFFGRNPRDTPTSYPSRNLSDWGWRPHGNRTTDIVVAVRGEEYTVSLHPALAGSEFRLANGSTLATFPTVTTPRVYHAVRLTLRSGGLHTVGVGSSAVDVFIPGVWDSELAEKDVAVFLAPPGGFRFDGSGRWWVEGREQLTTPGVVHSVADIPRWDPSPLHETDFHRAKLVSLRCRGQVHMARQLVVQGTAGSPAEGGEERGALRLDGGVGYVARECAWFPPSSLSLSLWLMLDPTRPAALISYAHTRGRGEGVPHAFSIVDHGSTVQVTLETSSAWSASVPDVWNPLTPLTLLHLGKQCLHTHHDVVRGGRSFPKEADCLSFCSSSALCAVCTPIGCSGLYRALASCRGNEPIACPSKGIHAKSRGWVHMQFAWRSVDGCWEWYRDGVREYQGCGVSVGRTVRSGGQLAIGQLLSFPGDIDPSLSAVGAIADVVLLSSFSSSSPEHVVGHWPLRGSLDDVSGHGRHLHFHGQTLQWTALLPPTAPDPPSPPPVSPPPSILPKYLHSNVLCIVDYDEEAVVIVSPQGEVTLLRDREVTVVGEIPPGHCVEPADVDDDGDVDLVAFLGDTVALLEARVGRFVRRDVVTGLVGGASGCVVDIDGDGKREYVTVHKDITAVPPPCCTPFDVAFDFERSLKAYPRDTRSTLQGGSEVWSTDCIAGRTALDLREGSCVVGHTLEYHPRAWGGWFRPSSLLGRQTLLAAHLPFSNDTNGVWGVWITGSTAWCSFGGAVASSPSVVVVGAWHHIHCVYSDGTLTAFVNSRRGDGVPSPEPVDPPPPFPMTIGCSLRNDTSHFFDGTVDAVRVFPTPTPQAHVEWALVSLALDTPTDDDGSLYLRPMYVVGGRKGTLGLRVLPGTPCVSFAAFVRGVMDVRPAAVVHHQGVISLEVGDAVECSVAGYNVSTPRRVDDAEWHHVGCVYDGGQLAVYVDWVREGVVPVPGVVVAGTPSSLVVGADGWEVADVLVALAPHLPLPRTPLVHHRPEEVVVTNTTTTPIPALGHVAAVAGYVSPGESGCFLTLPPLRLCVDQPAVLVVSDGNRTARFEADSPSMHFAVSHEGGKVSIFLDGSLVTHLFHVVLDGLGSQQGFVGGGFQGTVRDLRFYCTPLDTKHVAFLAHTDGIMVHSGGVSRRTGVSVQGLATHTHLCGAWVSHADLLLYRPHRGLALGYPALFLFTSNGAGGVVQTVLDEGHVEYGRCLRVHQDFVLGGRSDGTVARIRLRGEEYVAGAVEVFPGGGGDARWSLAQGRGTVGVGWALPTLGSSPVAEPSIDGTVVGMVHYRGGVIAATAHALYLVRPTVSTGHTPVLFKMKDMGTTPHGAYGSLTVPLPRAAVGKAHSVICWVRGTGVVSGVPGGWEVGVREGSLVTPCNFPLHLGGQWAQLAVNLPSSTSLLRVYVEGRAVGACHTDRPNQLVVQGWVRDLALHSDPLNEAALHGLLHEGHHAVFRFVPPNPTLCPSVGWEPVFNGSSFACLRSTPAPASLTYPEAVRWCRGQCDFVPSSPSAAAPQHCQQRCCNDPQCKGVRWTGRCVLLASPPHNTPVLLRKVAPVHHFPFEGSGKDLGTAGESMVLQGWQTTAGRTGKCVILGDGDFMWSRSSLPLSRWTVSVWVKAVRPGPSRCHWSLVGGSPAAISLCHTAEGLAVFLPDLPPINLTAPSKPTTWHLVEVSVSDGLFHGSVAALRATPHTVHVEGVAHSLFLGSSDASGRDSGGEWKYDELLVTDFPMDPSGGYGTRTTKGDVVSVQSRVVNTAVRNIAPAGPVWLGRGRGFEDYADDMQGDQSQKRVLMREDGKWTRATPNNKGHTVCESQGEQGIAAAAPMLHAEVDLGVPEPASHRWKLLVSHDASRGKYFPQGRYDEHRDEDMLLHMALPWWQYRNPEDGKFTLRLSWPKGACDGGVLEDIVWKQHSPPTQYHTVEGYEPVSVPYDVGFRGLSRSASQGSLMSGAPHLHFAVGATVRQECGFRGPGGRGVPAVELTLAVPGVRPPTTSVTFAVWIKARRESAGGDWEEGGDGCPGTSCGCDTASRGRPHGDVLEECMRDGCESATVSEGDMERGAVWTCPKGIGGGGKSAGWRVVRPATRRYGIVSYWVDGASHADFAISCEGRRHHRGRCAFRVGRFDHQTLHRRLYLNEPELIDNSWASEEWVHLAFTWESDSGCWLTARNGEAVRGGCGLNRGGFLRSKGTLVLGRHMLQAGVEGSTPDGALGGALASVSLWRRSLRLDELRQVMRGQQLWDDSLVDHWTMRVPDGLVGMRHGITLHTRDGAFVAHATGPDDGTRSSGRGYLHLSPSAAVHYEAPLNVHAEGLSVSLWHRSTASDRGVWSYVSPSGALEAGLWCRQGRCFVEIAGSTPLTTGDVFRSGRWGHLSVQASSQGTAVYYNAMRLAASHGGAVAGSLRGHMMANGTVDVSQCSPLPHVVTMARRRWVVGVRLLTYTRLIQVTVRVGEGVAHDPICARNVTLTPDGVNEVMCSAPVVGSAVSVSSYFPGLLCYSHPIAPLPERLLPGVLRVGECKGVPFDGDLAEVVVSSPLGSNGAKRDMQGSPDTQWKNVPFRHPTAHAVVKGPLPQGHGVHGTWHRVLLQTSGTFPAGAWEQDKEGAFSALARLGEEYRQKDLRMAFKLVMGGAEGVWEQTSLPTLAAVKGFGPIRGPLGGFRGLVRHSQSLLWGGNGSVVVGSQEGGTMVGFGLEEVDYAELSALGTDLCWDEWWPHMQRRCTHGVAAVKGTVEECKATCRLLAGCTGFSHSGDECLVHSPSFATGGGVALNLTTPTAQHRSTGVVTSAVYPWSDTPSGFPALPEMVGGVHLISPSHTPEGSLLSVYVVHGSWLYLVLVGNTSDAFNASTWERRPSLEVNGTETEVVTLRKWVEGGEGEEVLLPEGVVTAVVVQGRVEGGADCHPVYDVGSVHWSYRRVCERHAQYRQVALRQCSPGVRCDGRGCLAPGKQDGSGWSPSPDDCARRCKANPSCSFFTVYSDGWCSLLDECPTPHYIDPHRCPPAAPCITSRVVRAHAAAVYDENPPPLTSPTKVKALRASRVGVRMVWPLPFTVEFWLRIDAPCPRGVCTPLSHNTLEHVFSVQVTSTHVHRVSLGATWHPIDAPLQQQWNHVAIAYSQEGRGEVVVNGVVQATFAAPPHPSTRGLLRLGDEVLVQRLVVWTTYRPPHMIASCRGELPVAGQHGLVALWPLEDDLRDRSGNGMDLVPLPHTLWTEESNVGLVGGLFLPPVRSSSACVARCSAVPECVGWTWDEAKGCTVTTSSAVWAPVDRAVSGRYRACPGLRWVEEVGSVLGGAVPTTWPSAPLPPQWWHFDVKEAAACGAACYSEEGCQGWSLVTLAGGNKTCFGVRVPSTPDTGVPVVSGRNLSCPDYPSVTLVDVPSGQLDGLQHVWGLCSGVGRVPVVPRDVEHVRWLAAELLAQRDENSSTEKVPIAVNRGKGWEDLQYMGSPLAGLAAALQDMWGGSFQGDDHLLGLSVEGNVSIASWGYSSTTAVLCEGSSLPYDWVADGVDVHTTHSPVCRAPEAESCHERCRHGNCVSPTGPCLCHQGYYPQDNCSRKCFGDVQNGTDCSTPIPVLDSSSITAAVFTTVPLHIESFHADVASIVVVRRGGRTCSAEGGWGRSARYLVRAPNRVACEGAVDRAGGGVYLWSPADNSCFVAEDFTAQSSSEFVGCALRGDTTDSDYCANREGDQQVESVEFHGEEAGVVHITATEVGEYTVCHKDSAGSPPTVLGRLSVRSWTCAERRLLFPEAPCV